MEKKKKKISAYQKHGRMKRQNMGLVGCQTVLYDTLMVNTRHACVNSQITVHIQHSFESLSHRNQTRKRNKRNPNWRKRRKLSLLADDTTLYKENPTAITRKLLELINEFG